jgi:hypothetical protein
MKDFFKILFGVIIAGAIAGYIYLQKNKKSIVKNSIQNAIQKKSDSLYFIHYDSSKIDEVNGNASFYNISLQSDSVQKSMLKTSDSLPNALYNIRADEITATGIDIPGLLKGQNVTAKSITIIKPVIKIINTGADKPKPFTYKDTLDLYKKILGRFNSISTDTIQVIKGTVLITDKKGKELTTLDNINISLNHFLIDSTRNYQNLISYFIKDVKVTIQNIQLPEFANSSRINITNLLYDAPKKLLHLDAVQQYKLNDTNPIVNIKNVQINQLNTDAFILFQQLKAGLVTCDGGLVTVYKKNKKLLSGDEAIVLTNNLIDEAQIGGIQLGKTNIVVINPEKPGQEPFVIHNVKFTASNIISNTNGGTLSDLVNNADWELFASGFSFINKQKIYKFIVQGLQLNNKTGIVKVNRILYKPLLTEAAFVHINKVQKDRYDLSFKNINLTGVNFKKLISNNMLEIEHASLEPVLKIFNDRTLPFDTTSKVGKYPHQLLMKLPFRLYVKKVVVNNGAVFYKERGRKSKKNGIVTFTSINAQINNITNISERIKRNGILRLNATARFLNAANVVTEWLLPLNILDTAFTVTGHLGAMDAMALNSITKPLSMTSVKKGKINKLKFDITGNNYEVNGQTTFLYTNLDVTVLKMSNNKQLKKRSLLSLLANIFIANNNPKNNKTYVGEIDFTRDIQKSFFNLLWKSIFSGVKNTLMRN